MDKKIILYIAVAGVILLLIGVIWKNILFSLLAGYLLGFANCLFALKVEPKLKKVI